MPAVTWQAEVGARGEKIQKDVEAAEPAMLAAAAALDPMEKFGHRPTAPICGLEV